MAIFNVFSAVWGKRINPLEWNWSDIFPHSAKVPEVNKIARVMCIHDKERWIRIVMIINLNIRVTDL
ncbi:hypothetical protein BLK93_21160 [Klebsiella pneumoniae]|nr:hypothetical protein BLK93_21160 [Klebsiella pneumoniae]